MAPRKKDAAEQEQAAQIKKIQNLDSVLHNILDDNDASLTGIRRNSDINRIYSKFEDISRNDNYNVVKTKSSNQTTYDFIANALLGERAPMQNVNFNGKELTDSQKKVLQRANLENIFSNTDMNAAAIFLNGSSDVMRICDEVESVCAYMYQLEEAINVIRDNVMGNEKSLQELPFDITFETSDDKAAQYVKTVKDALREVQYRQKLNDHAVPKGIKFGRYYMMIIPFSEIGTKMLSTKVNQTHSIFSIPTYESTTGEQLPVEESVYVKVMEDVNKLLDGAYESSVGHKMVTAFGLQKTYADVINHNIRNLTVCDEDTPPNVFGVSEAYLRDMTDDLQTKVKAAMQRNNTLFNAGLFGPVQNKEIKDEDKHFSDATITTDDLENIPGCFIRMVDPRQLVPIKIFDYVLGYYYFENYDYARMGTSITDILSNQINFQDHNMLVDNIVTGVLKNLKYGDILAGDNNFKTMVLNCIFYAERRNNPIRIKFVPVDYVTEFKTNCDQDGNGQPVLLRSLPYARLYTSLLLFTITTVITKSTDSEFYYLKEGALSQSYEDQVADIIEQFRNSNIDISQVINGNLLHGNRAINKRYFMSVGTQDIRPFDVEVVSGQNVDTHTEFLNDLRKMAIGSTGVPAVAVDYMDEVEFATILKMTNTKTLNRSNNIQSDFNPAITESVKRIVKYNKPNSIPAEVLNTMKCTFQPCNTINNNISSDEINNVQATVDSMIETWYKGQETETPDIVKFEKEEMRKRLIKMLTPSLPWGEMESMVEDVKISARRQYEENKMKSEQSESEEEM
jgi:hypothetical protein